MRAGSIGADPAIRRMDRTVTGWTASGSYEVTSRPIAGRRPAGRHVGTMTPGQSTWGSDSPDDANTLTVNLTTPARYTAHYVEAVFPPGMRTAVHRHHGPEASYVVDGTECVETPDGKIMSRAGEGAVVAEGTPMLLVNPGPGTRRAVALILHDAAHPWSVPAPDWRPTGLCGG
jgi:quercetin dioxygenase-like cupin family protein